MILIINNNEAVWQHLSGFKSLEATAKLSFRDQFHANCFIARYNEYIKQGRDMDDFKEAMPTNEEVHFSVYHQLPNGKEHKDDMIKPIGWVHPGALCSNDESPTHCEECGRPYPPEE